MVEASKEITQAYERVAMFVVITTKKEKKSIFGRNLLYIL